MGWHWQKALRQTIAWQNCMAKPQAVRKARVEACTFSGRMFIFLVVTALWVPKSAQGAGLAFAEKYKGTDNVCLTFFGDGAARQGILHETFNIAMTWKLPVVFICENNNYAMGTSVERTSNVVDIYKLADAYEMPSDSVDGMSAEAVHDSVARAVKRAREGGGPTLLEIKTYRYKGHSISDPQKYRTKEEVEEYKQRDPIQQVRKSILDNRFATEQELEMIDKRVADKVIASVKFAEESPWPDDDEVYKDIVKQEDYPFIVD